MCNILKFTAPGFTTTPRAENRIKKQMGETGFRRPKVPGNGNGRGLLGFVALCILVTIVLLLTGCGHNLVRVDRGLGLMLRVPLPDGSSIIDLKMGKIDSTTTMLRGNATYTGGSTVDGSVGGGSGTSASANVGGVTTESMFLSTGTQLNEGNIKDIFVDDSVDAETKKILANYLLLHAQLQATESSLKQQEYLNKVKAEEDARQQAKTEAATAVAETATTTESTDTVVTE